MFTMVALIGLMANNKNMVLFIMFVVVQIILIIYQLLTHPMTLNIAPLAKVSYVCIYVSSTNQLLR